MKDRLTKEEVMHVANLARIEVDEDEIAMYQVKLKEILDEIEKINDVEVSSDDILISPTNNKCELRKDEPGEMLTPEEVLKNAPRHSGNYFKVPVVINEKGDTNA